MRISLENDTQLNLSACEISFTEDPFAEESSVQDPVFYEVKKALSSYGEQKQGSGLLMNEEEMEGLKMEHFLSGPELRQWEKMSGTDRQRVLEKIYASEEYRKLKEVLEQYRDPGIPVSAGISPKAAGRAGDFQKKRGKSTQYAGHKDPRGKEGETHRERPQAPKRDAGKDDPPQNTGLPAAVKANGNTYTGAGMDAQMDLPLQSVKDIGSYSGKGNVLSHGAQAAKKAAEIFREGAQYTCQDNGAQQKQEEKRMMNVVPKTMKSAAVTVVMGQIPVFAFLAVLTIFILLLLLLAVLLGSANTVAENPGIMPYYCQADYPAVPFDGDTIQSSGCGITSMAMVVSLFKEEAVTPPALAELAIGDSRYNTVRSHQAVLEFARHYELGEAEQMAGPSKNCCGNRAFDMDYIKKKIAANCPVIVSLTGGYYNPSGGGHYIALYGSGKGGVFVYDPGSRSKYAQSLQNDGSSWEEVFSCAKHIWIFRPYVSSNLMEAGDGTNCMAVYLYLKQAGFSDAAASGVLGNMWQECAHGHPDLRPAMESADGSIGLLQWRDGRRAFLENLAVNRSSTWADISVQIEYLLQEINSGNQWIWTGYAARHYPADCNLLLEEYKQLEDPEKAAEVFCAKFVRPNYEKANLPYRKETARGFYMKITAD